MARVGILTGGGDCPGLNAVIRAVVRVGLGARRIQNGSVHRYLAFGFIALLVVLVVLA